jgi:hypothetical protein
MMDLLLQTRYLKVDLTTIITFFNKNLTPRDKSTPRIDFELREEGENNREIYFSNSQFSDQMDIEEYIHTNLSD